MRAFLSFAFLLGISLANVFAQEATKFPVINVLPNESARQDIEAKDAIAEALRTKTFDLNLIDTPVETFARQLEKHLGVPVRLNAHAMEQLGLSPDMPITYAMSGLRAQTHLKLLLRQLELTYVVTPHEVVITTHDDAEWREEARFYPLNDLIYIAEAGPNVQPDFDSIIEVLTTSIDPDMWDDGGPTISPINDGISVSQIGEVHEHIAGLLKAIRQAKVYPSDAYPTEAVSISQLGEITAKLHQQLDKRQVTLKFTDTPLSDAVTYLAQKSEIPIFIDARGLEDMGLASDLPITCDLQEVSLNQALEVLREQYELAWYTLDNVVVITTEEEVAAEIRTCVYPIRDLLCGGLDITKPEVQKLLQSIRSRGFGSFGWEPWREVGLTHAPRFNDYDSIIESITTTVECDSWEELGGPGSIAPFDEFLIVSQTEHVHEKLAAFLADVRRHPRKFDPEQVAQQIEKENAEMEVVMFESPVDQNGAPKLTREDLQAIAARVQTSVATDTWDGDQHFIDTTHSGLIVRARKDVQREVAKYLQQINIQPSPRSGPFPGAGYGGGYGGGFGGGMNGPGGGNIPGGGFMSPSNPQPTSQMQPANPVPAGQQGGFF